MIEDVKRKNYINIIYIIAIILVLLSNVFSGYFSKLLYLEPDIIETDKTQVHFISVGQGDAIAISFASGETMLIDSGTELYRKKLTRYLDNIVLTDKKIDYLVLTHTDLDHSSNMEYIIDNYEIGTFYRPPVYLEDEDSDNYIVNDAYESIINKLTTKNIPIVFNDDDNLLVCGTSKISWLYPDIDDLYRESSTSTNIYSAVMILEDNGKKVMFTGDIDDSIEMSLMNLYSEELLDVDILKLAHHGSNTSTSSDFLEVTSPDYAIISVGENSYGHPSEEVLSRIIDYDANNNTNLQDNLYRTDKNVNIILTLDREVIIETIDNIDKYSFSKYWIYTILVVIILLLFMLGPYIKVWYKRWRYSLHNKMHKRKNNIKEINL